MGKCVGILNEHSINRKPVEQQAFMDIKNIVLICSGHGELIDRMEFPALEPSHDTEIKPEIVRRPLRGYERKHCTFA